MIIKNNRDSNDVEELLENASKEGAGYTGFEGSLINNYIFYNSEKLKVDDDCAKFIVCRERALNEWNSNYTFILTDDEEVVSRYEDEFEKSNNLEEISV